MTHHTKIADEAKAREEKVLVEEKLPKAIAGVIRMHALQLTPIKDHPLEFLLAPEDPKETGHALAKKIMPLFGGHHKHFSLRIEHTPNENGQLKLKVQLHKGLVGDDLDAAAIDQALRYVPHAAKPQKSTTNQRE